MILNCNSCSKKFVVPDNAITASGRMVQCGSCGNKWKQFPENQKIKTKAVIEPKLTNKKEEKTKKDKKKSKPKKVREISLYSPEYLAKKHGINLNDTVPKKIRFTKKEKTSFGFYNLLLLFIVLIISISRILYFTQDQITNYFPSAEFYLDYFFESMRNIFEIWKNLIKSY